MSTKIVAARLATSAGVTTIITRSSNPGNIANIVTYIQSLKSSPQSITSQPCSPPSGNTSPATTLVNEPLSRPTASLKLEPVPIAPLHTRFIPSPQPIRDRYFWLLHGLAPHGTVYIDTGAHRALENKAGLLPVGVVDVEGTFAQQEAVRLVVVDRIPRSTLSARSSTPTPVNGINQGVKLWEGPGMEVGRALVNYSAIEIMRIKGVRSSEIEGLLGYAESEYVALRENISFFKRESRPVTPSLELL
jgi:glutamate 5-kinase